MPSVKLTTTPKTYAELRDAVVAVVVKGRAEIDRAWVETYHETGRLINEHVLLFRDRADYGAKTYARLADDTRIDVRTLQHCAQFQRCFPIASTCSQLDWSKCRLLCQVADAKQREKLRLQAVKNHWIVTELESRVRAFNATAIESGETKRTAEPVELLTPRRGTPGLHQVIDRGSGPVVDLGFKFYRELSEGAALGAARLRPYKTGEIVRFASDGSLRRVENASKAELFTYAATVRRVIDGDTLDIAIAVAPGFSHELKLRLRGLDCPELSTAAGRAAKAFVDGLLKPGDEIVVSTTKPDKYERYLADVFVGQELEDGRVKSEDRSPPLKLNTANLRLRAGSYGTVFLNNALLERGHAVRYDGGAKAE